MKIPLQCSAVTFLPTVNELSSIHSLCGNEGLFAHFEAVWVSEHNLGKRRPSSRVMDDILNYTLQGCQ